MVLADVPWHDLPWWQWPEAQTAFATWALSIVTIVLLGATLLTARAAVATLRLEREPAIIAEQPTAELERERQGGAPLQRYYFEFAETGDARLPYRLGERNPGLFDQLQQTLNPGTPNSFSEIVLRNVGRSAAVDLHIQFNIAIEDKTGPMEIVFLAQVNAVPVGAVMLKIANRSRSRLRISIDPHTAYDVPARRKRRFPLRGWSETKRRVEVYSGVIFFCAPGRAT